jgi:hypothetical protein
MITVASSFLLMQIDPRSGAWSVLSAGENLPTLRNARIGIAFRAGRKRVRCTFQDFKSGQAAPLKKDRTLGCFRVLTVAVDMGYGLAVNAEWRVSLEKPFLLWRIVLKNLNPSPLQIDSIDMCQTGRRFGAEGGVELPIPPADRAIFVNGWQSWSFAGGLRSADRQPGPMLGLFDMPMHEGTSLRSTGRPGHFVSDMFTSIGRPLGGDCLVAGFLSQNEQFGAVET